MPAHPPLTGPTASPLAVLPPVYYINNTLVLTTGGDTRMDIRAIQPRDWMIAIAAFIAGAFIF